MNEPTPGPWKLRKEDTPSGVPQIIVGDGFNDIAHVYTNAAEDFGWADAHLIEAAPALLEAAKEAHDELSGLLAPWAERLAEKLEKAIRKAEKHG